MRVFQSRKKNRIITISCLLYKSIVTFIFNVKHAFLQKIQDFALNMILDLGTKRAWHSDCNKHSVTPTSSTEQQVGPGLCTGPRLGRFGLELSPEPRVEQGHAQKIKPAKPRRKAQSFNVVLMWNVNVCNAINSI